MLPGSTATARWEDSVSRHHRVNSSTSPSAAPELAMSGIRTINATPAAPRSLPVAAVQPNRDTGPETQRIASPRLRSTPVAGAAGSRHALKEQQKHCAYQHDDNAQQ